LLSVALAANAVLFSVADSVIFHRIPYADSERLVEIHRRTGTGRRGDAFMSPALLDAWREQKDLFVGVEGHLSKSLFLAGDGEPEIVATADVTIGLMDLLGVRPGWGRGFVAGDERQLTEPPVLIAESLARERFGSPAAAVGQRLATTGEPLIVIGVMPSDFRFPDNVHRIWRALDPRGPLARGFVGVSSIARLAPAASRELAAQVMAQRSDAIGAAAGARMPYVAEPAELRGAIVRDEERRMFLLLLGAALALLLIACANVASLELAAAVDRARVSAIQLALGASRAGLARIALLEGMILLAIAMALGGWFSRAALAAIGAQLPARLTRGGANPIDFDERAFLFAAAGAAVAWLLSSLPAVAFAARRNLLDLLKLEGHAVAASIRSGSVRRVLTILEVALAVLLLVAGVAYVRSYQALLAQDKGFDSSGVVTINLTIPPQSYSSPAARSQLRHTVADLLRERPGVLAASAASPPPDMGQSFAVGQIEIDGRGPLDADDLTIAELDVEPEYFSVLRVPLLSGRMFEAGDGPTDMIVSETFATKYWPGQQAVGHSYRRDPLTPWRRVIGVVGHVRSSYDPPGDRSSRILQTYYLRQPPPPPVSTKGARPVWTGGSYGFVNVMARVDSRSRVADLYQTIRHMDSSFILSLDFVDDEYAKQYEDRLLATRVVGGFGILAFLVAAAGVYSVMTFLVAQRTRELGVRVALGATRRDIRRLVLGASMKLALAGAVVGIALTWFTGRWVESQLYSVKILDPLATAGVAAGVLIITACATWRPVRRATRVDPTVLLRNE
jgi:predicted permease